MKIKTGKHVKIICELNEGDQVMTDGCGYKLDGKIHKVKEIKFNIGHCKSGVMVRISGYAGWLDSDWLDKVNPSA